jgi:predicted secreted acid phosphatase
MEPKLRTLAIICDLDGTLYNARERQEVYLLSGKKDFDGFHRAAKHDNPHWWCLHLVQAMRKHGYHILFVSGRDDAFRDETIAWLELQLWIKRHEYELLMRPTGDYTADDVMKKQMYREHIEPRYSVLFCIDDRKRVVDMWRRLGLTCLQCAEGNF